MEKENFSDDDLARLTAESPQWASRGSLSIVMYQSLKICSALGVWTSQILGFELGPNIRYMEFTPILQVHGSYVDFSRILHGFNKLMSYGFTIHVFFLEPKTTRSSYVIHAILIPSNINSR